MCKGEFSLTDPRCINSARTECFWCQYALGENWWTKDAGLRHAESCPMKTQWQGVTSP